MDAGLVSTILFTYPIFCGNSYDYIFKEKNSINHNSFNNICFLGVILLYKGDGANI